MTVTRVTVGQFGPVADAETNFAAINELARQAAAAEAALLVLPEEAMLLAEDVPPPLAAEVERVWPMFCELLSDLAAHHGLAIIAGGYEPSGTERPYNTLVAVTPEGATQTYRKLHLYDAFAYQESGYVTRGTELPPVIELAGLRVGLINCYDLRFPEQARALIDQDADLLAISAAWVCGPMKETHWQTLTQARAIENTVWVAAAGSISSGCIGGSRILSPLGEVLAELSDEPLAAVSADIDLERTASVRDTLPALANRRIILTYQVQEDM